jgi:hypothetical protein
VCVCVCYRGVGRVAVAVDEVKLVRDPRRPSGVELRPRNLGALLCPHLHAGFYQEGSIKVGYVERKVLKVYHAHKSQRAGSSVETGEKEGGGIGTPK